MPNERSSSPHERLLAHLREGDQPPPRRKEPSWDEMYRRILAAADSDIGETDGEDCLREIAAENRADPHSDPQAHGQATTPAAPISIFLAHTMRPLIAAATKTLASLLSDARLDRWAAMHEGAHRRRHDKAPIGV